MKVLIADDTKLEYLENLVMENGHDEVVAACLNPGAALEAAKELKPDIALIDVHFTDASSDFWGVNVARCIYQIHNIPCVYKTVDDRWDTMSRIFQEGVFGFCGGLNLSASSLENHLRFASMLFESNEKHARYIRLAIDAEKKVTAINYCARVALGIKDMASTCGQPIEKYITTESAEVLADAIKEMAGPASCKELELEILGCDAVRKIFACRLEPIMFFDEFLGCNILGWDVTEPRAYEERLRAAERLRDVGLKTAGVAHDTGNILQRITFAVGLMRMQPDESMKWLEAIDSAAKDLREMNDRMLKFAKQADEPKVPVDLDRLVSKAAENDVKGFAVDTVQIKTVHSGSSLWVMGNEVELRGAILNLVKNATEAITETGREGLVEIRVEQTEDNRLITEGAEPRIRYGRIVVRDNGGGMSEATMKALLQPFFSTKKEKGTGLGLVNVKGTVEKHGGYLTVLSTLDQGTTISMHLPLVNPPVR